MTALSLFKHRTHFQIRYMDLDAMQHVNNARYLNYMEEARIAYSRDVLGLFQDNTDFNVVVARVEIDYKAPLVFGEEVIVLTRVSRIGNRSHDFECLIIGKKGDQEKLAAHSIATLVGFDPAIGKSRPLASHYTDQIRAYEIADL